MHKLSERINEEAMHDRESGENKIKRISIHSKHTSRAEHRNYHPEPGKSDTNDCRKHEALFPKQSQVQTEDST
jgi:hypothetical protein